MYRLRSYQTRSQESCYRISVLTRNTRVPPRVTGPKSEGNRLLGAVAVIRLAFSGGRLHSLRAHCPKRKLVPYQSRQSRLFSPIYWVKGHAPCMMTNNVPVWLDAPTAEGDEAASCLRWAKALVGYFSRSSSTHRTPLEPNAPVSMCHSPPTSRACHNLPGDAAFGQERKNSCVPFFIRISR